MLKNFNQKMDLLRMCSLCVKNLNIQVSFKWAYPLFTKQEKLKVFSSVNLTPQMIVIPHKQLIKQISVYDWLFSCNEVKEYLYLLFKRAEDLVNHTTQLQT